MLKNIFKKSRVKIVIAIMAVLVALFAGTLCVIYGSSYYEVLTENQRMLARYVNDFPPLPQSDDEKNIDPKAENDPKMPSMSDVPPPGDMHKFELSTFYAVTLSQDHQILSVKNDAGSLFSEDDLSALALKIVNSGKEKGIINNLAFLCIEKNDYILVAFMDNTIMHGSMTMLFRNTLIFGGFSVIAIFAVAVILSKRIVAPLEESYQKQQQFISDAGHELKTPIAVISANAEILEREVGSNQWLSNIQYENEHMGILVKQLLELARTENNTPQISRVDFSRLVAGEALPFESLAFEHNLTLNCAIAENVYINGNSNQLRQLISILLDNAIRYSPKDNAVDLSLQTDRSHAILSVTNVGSYIPPEQQKQLFERFYRVDASRNSEEGHFGLGLAIAKAIVLSHQGKINVSCHDGQVQFTVTLPLHQK